MRWAAFICSSSAVARSSMVAAWISSVGNPLGGRLGLGVRLALLGHGLVEGVDVVVTGDGPGGGEELVHLAQRPLAALVAAGGVSERCRASATCSSPTTGPVAGAGVGCSELPHTGQGWPSSRAAAERGGLTGELGLEELEPVLPGVLLGARPPRRGPP